MRTGRIYRMTEMRAVLIGALKGSTRMTVSAV